MHFFITYAVKGYAYNLFYAANFLISHRYCLKNLFVGLHDLKRVYQLVKKFNIRAGCIINKADLNVDKQKEIKRFLMGEGIDHLVDLPYDETFTKAMTLGQTIVEYDANNLTNLLEQAWVKIKQLTNQNKTDRNENSIYSYR